MYPTIHKSSKSKNACNLLYAAWVWGYYTKTYADVELRNTLHNIFDGWHSNKGQTPTSSTNFVIDNLQYKSLAQILIGKNKNKLWKSANKKFLKL